MAFVVADRVQETTTTAGTGTLSLAGAVSGYKTFVSGIGSGNSTYYTIYDQTAQAWEVGIGTVTSGAPNTLSRTTVLSNSLGTTALISLAGNSSLVYCDYPAGKAVYYDSTGNTITGLPLVNPTVTNYVETLFTANTSTAITVNLANGTVQQLTLTANTTITMPTAVAGKSFIILLAQDATGGRTVTWSTVKWPSATAPTITSTASKTDLYSFFSDGTNWYGTTVGQAY